MKKISQSQKTIKVFSTQSCPYCHMVKHYLEEKGVKYEDIDVSVDQESASLMFEKSHQMGVPQLWIGDNVVVGFDPTSIDQLLDLK